jgi:hypothetical protein
MNLGKAILSGAREVKRVRRMQKFRERDQFVPADIRWQPLERVAYAPNRNIIHRKPIPKSGAFILFKLPPDCMSVSH